MSAVLLALALLFGGSLREGDQGQQVTEVQYTLKSFGYAIPVDGDFGSRTTKVVKLWQKQNGLKVDGVVGPATLASLQAAGTASAAAARLPSVALTGCARATWFRQQAGLPDQFDAIVHRESNCRNDVTSSTGCCVGLLQIHTGNFTAPGYKAGIRACGVTRRSDILGDSDAQWAANMCVAKVLYDVSGMNPWRL